MSEQESGQVSEQEKEAIEKIKEELIEPFYYFPNPKSIFLEDTQVKLLETTLNLIEKLQKENEELKEKLHEKNLRIIKLNKLLGGVNE